MEVIRIKFQVDSERAAKWMLAAERENYDTMGFIDWIMDTLDVAADPESGWKGKNGS